MQTPGATDVRPAGAVSALLTSKHSRKAYWIRQTVLWHWVSSAMCLGAMLLFTITGITLNHAAQISSAPTIQKAGLALPVDLQSELRKSPWEGKKSLPKSVVDWLASRLPERHLDGVAEWSATEIYLSLPRPGGDGWINIDREAGHVEWEQTNRGWIAYLNDLHKGRHTGWVWRAFIDVVAVAFLVFTATGLILLQIHSSKRRSTWPIVALGFTAPMLLLIVFMHL